MNLPKAKGINKVYRSLLEQMGAELVDVLDSGKSPQGVYRVDGRPPEKGTLLRKYFDDWFEPDPNGGYRMRMTDHNAVDAFSGRGATDPQTAKLSRGEKWLRDRTFGKNHFYGSNSPGGNALNKGANKGIGRRIPDASIGAANTAKGLLESLEAAHSGNLAGTLDIGEKPARDALASELSELRYNDLIDSHLASETFNQAGGPTPRYARHPLMKVSDSDLDSLKGRQFSDAELKSRGAVTDVLGNPYEGSKRGMAGLLKERGMLGEASSNAAERVGAKPAFSLTPGGNRRAIQTGLKIAPNAGLDAAQAIGKVARIGGPAVAWSLPGIALDMAFPEANDAGREIASDAFGQYADTDNWFGGSEQHRKFSPEWRRNNLENIGRFAGDMALDTVYTLAGIFDPTKERTKPTRRFLVNKNRRGLIE